MVEDRSFDRMQLRDAVVEEMQNHEFLFSPRTVDAISRCSEVEVVSKTPDGRQHTLYAARCHHRACPICQQIKHRKYAAFLKKVDREQREFAEERIGKSMTDEAWYGHYKFITLSPFVSSFDLMDLADKLSWLSKTFTKNLRYYFNTKVGVAPLGYLRTFEITYDKDKGFHPHMHAILLYPERAPFVDQIEVERSLFKALQDTPYLGTLSDGRPQETVSVDIRDCYKKGGHFGEFELTKYIAKAEDFDDLSLYVRLAAAWGRVPQFRASGCFAGISQSHKKQDAIIQNANCVEFTTYGSECVVFYGSSQNRLAYLVRPEIAHQAASFFARERKAKFDRNYNGNVWNDHRRWAWSNSLYKPLVFWFESDGLHVHRLPEWTGQDEEAYLNECRRSISFSPNLASSKLYRVVSKKLSEKLGFEQVCLMEII